MASFRRFNHKVRGQALASVAVMALAGVGTPALAQVADQTNTSSATTVAPQSDEPREDIVVTGRRAAIESAILRKEKSDTLIDSVMADDAGKLPDTSITEVLQRVSGVSIVRFAALGNPDSFSAQGSGIQVRGLSGVAGRLNGREIFSANGGRQLSFGDITPELMSAVDVYKSSTADLIEGGTGGQIDLRTKMPFDYNKLTLQASAGIDYGDLRNKSKGGGSVLLTDNFQTGIGEIGILVDVARNSFTQLSHYFRMEPYYKTLVGGQNYFVPGGFTYGDQSYDRTRTGLYGAIQWKPASNLEFSGIYFQSKYDETSFGHGVFAVSKNYSVNPANSTFDDNNGLLTSDAVFLVDPATLQPSGANITAGGDTGYAKTRSKTSDASFVMKWDAADRLHVDAAFQYVKSTAQSKSYDLFPNIPYPGSFALDLTGSLPEVSIPSSLAATLADPSQYMWNASMDHLSDNVGKEYAGNVDMTYDLSDDGFFRTLKFGARYADRSEYDQNSAYNWQAFGQGWNGSPATNFGTGPATDVQYEGFNDFFRGKASLPSPVLLPSDAAAQRFDVAGDHALYGNPIQPIGFTELSATRSSTKTFATYALLRFQQEGLFGGSMQGNVGVRFLRNKNRSDGFFEQTAATVVDANGNQLVFPNVGAPRGGGRTYSRALPSINIQLLPTSKVHFRFAYNITLDNPSFQALSASGQLSVRTLTNPAGNGAPGIFDGFNTTSGNPNLKPLISNNLDLSLEWYPRAGTAFHLAGFRKILEDPLIYGSASQPIAVTYPDGTTQTALVQSTNVFNATQNAKVQGFEAGGRTFFDMLPGFLAGFGIEANYTFIDSKNPGDSYFDINGVNRSDVPLQGLSKHNVNVTGLYERGAISARVAYSWRSRYLMSTNSNGTNGDYLYFTGPNTSTFTDIALPVYSEPYGQFDAGITFRVDKHLALSVQGSNLTNTVAKTSMGGYDNGQRYIRSWFVSDRRFAGTATVSF